MVWEIIKEFDLDKDYEKITLKNVKEKLYYKENYGRLLIAKKIEKKKTKKQNLRKRDSGLFGKVRAKIAEFTNAIEKACEKVIGSDGNISNSVAEEARLLKDYAHQMRVLWNNALKEAGESESKGYNETNDSSSLNMIRYDTNNVPFVEVEEDILDGVAEDKWSDTVKRVLKSKLKKGVKVGRNTIWQNIKGRNEFVFSKYMQKIYNTDKTLYMDKLRISNNADEVVIASRDYVNQELKHKRKDGLKEFAWGTVNLRMGNNDYRADVIIGNNGTKLYLYDVVNLKEITIKERRSNHPRYSQNEKVQNIIASSKDSITENDESDNTQILNQSRGSSNDSYNELMKKYERLEQESDEAQSKLWAYEDTGEFLAYKEESKNAKKGKGFFSEEYKREIKAIKDKYKKAIEKHDKLQQEYYDKYNKMAGVRKEIGRIDKLAKEKDRNHFYEQVYNNIDNYVNKAEKRFGTTKNYRLAAYITTKGSMLDFSEGREQRTLDHREIREVLDTPENAGYSDGLIAFVNAGNIRMNTNGVEIAKNPTEKQLSLLRGFFNSLNGEVTVDFAKENGDVEHSVEYSKGTSSARILNDIKKYYEDGTVPENTYNQLSDFLYQSRNYSYEELTNKEDMVIPIKNNIDLSIYSNTTDIVNASLENLRKYPGIEYRKNNPVVTNTDTGDKIQITPKAIKHGVYSKNNEASAYIAQKKEVTQAANDSVKRIPASNNFAQDALASPSNSSISQNNESGNTQILNQSRDSSGRTLTKAKQEYFKNSKALDNEGRLLTLYHQTGANFTVFNSDNEIAGKNDSELPTGFYLKTNSNDIGVGGNIQMEVYANITNPIIFENRMDAVMFWKRNIKGYEEAYNQIKNIDKEYQKKFNDAWEKSKEEYKKTGNNGRTVTSYIAFNPNQIKNVTNENPTDEPDIRYQSRNYSYEELTNKPPIKVLTVKNVDYSKYNSRSDILDDAMNNLKNDPEVTVNKEIALIHNNDSDIDVEVSRRRLRHGIARRANEASKFVTLNIGSAIKYGIKVNEADGKRDDANKSSVFMGKMADTQGQEYYYRLIVNETTEGDYEVNRLYAAKAKKKVVGGNAPTPASINTAKLNTFFDLKVSDLLNEVKDYYGDSLSEDVNKNLGRERGETDIEDLLYQSRQNQKSYEVVLRENKKYRELVEDLRKQFKVSEDYKVRTDCHRWNCY